MASRRVTETPFFLTTKPGRRLFCLMHEPSHPLKGAILYCNPPFEEHLHSYRTAVSFARYASRRGWGVMRFSYFGEGESDGIFEEATVSSRVADILAVAGDARRRFQTGLIHLVGLRLGATLALLASQHDQYIPGVVCWAPLLKVADYFHGLLRSNIASQLVHWKGVPLNKDALVERLYSGETINLEGYEVGRGLYDEATAIDLTVSPLHSPSKLLILQPVKGSIPEAEVTDFLACNEAMHITRKVIKAPAFWQKLRVPDPSCDAIFEASVQWLVNPEAHLHGNAGQVPE